MMSYSFLQKDAEAMCEQSLCYDLLSRMYQASNRWDEALQLAHTKDRINLKRTYYEYARHLEGEGTYLVNLFLD
jgi:intraflagellar transport protein 140